MTTDTLEKPAVAQQPVAMQVWHEISQTLYREARMLENEQYRDWIATFVHPDILYQVAEKQSRMRRDRYTGPDIVFAWNDGLADIEMRLRALESGMQWSSNPVEATRRNISNVEVYQGEDADSFVVYANLWSVRNRRVYDEMTHSYARRDVWQRQADGRVLLTHRFCSVDQRYVRGKNLAFFL